MRIKVASEVTALLAAHDAAKLYDSLEPWQQRELLCLLRRIINSLPQDK